MRTVRDSDTQDWLLEFVILAALFAYSSIMALLVLVLILKYGAIMNYI